MSKLGFFTVRALRHKIAKEDAVIFYISDKRILLNSSQLRELVPAAKQGDSLAMERLCHAFTPLVHRFSHSENLYNVLGEDAENTLWVLFLEGLANFDSSVPEMFPGFIRRHLVNRVLNIFKRNGLRFQSEMLSPMEEDSEECRVPAADMLQPMLNNLALSQVLGKLPKQQSYVLEQFYCRNKSLEEIANTLGVSTRTVRYHRQMALNSLRRCV